MIGIKKKPKHKHLDSKKETEKTKIFFYISLNEGQDLLNHDLLLEEYRGVMCKRVPGAGCGCSPLLIVQGNRLL